MADRLRPLAVVFCAVIVAGILYFSYASRPGSDFKIYVASGEAVLQGKDIYDAPLEVTNTGPPFFSLFCVGPAVLERISPTFARGTWTLLNAAALVVCLTLCAHLVYRRCPPLWSGSVLIPLLLTLPYVLYHLLYHQVNLFVFALTLSGLTFQEEHKEKRGGILLGAACSLKVMPILFVPYLAYRRRWSAAFWALAATAVFSLSPGFVMGWDRFRMDVRHWWGLLPHNPIWDAGQRNQSVLAMWDRILGHGFLPFVSPGKNNLAMSGAPSVRIAWMVTVAVIGLAMLWSFRKQPIRGSISILLEWSTLLIVSSLFGPVSWKHYLVVLLLPNMVLHYLGSTRDDQKVRRMSLALLWGCFLVAISASRVFREGDWSLRLGMASTTTLAMLTMILGLLWLRCRVGVRDIEVAPALPRLDPPSPVLEPSSGRS
jgi:hypothetical protein